MVIPRPLISVLVIVVVSAALIATRDVGYLSTKQHPPHTAPTVAWVPQDYPDWIGALEVSRDAFYRENEERENERLAEERRLAAAAEQARADQVRPGVPSPTAVPARPDCAGIPSWFPQYIAWRESNCTRGINTGNGYFGYAQVAAFHWFGGVCAGLTWTVPEQEDECVWRLSAGGTSFAPWGA